MNSTLEIIFGLVGGLAIFLYGMNLMSECLQKAAGEKMKTILSLLTKNPILGVLAGALTTAVLQSSSATTVMAIGFVSAGLMSLPQAIFIILGANIGTTMTAQIIAFKISDYIFIIIFIGFIISFIAKSEKLKNIGFTIFAFGLLFLGIETMGDVMKPLASSPVFISMIGKVKDIPVLGIAVGTLMTLVVQSSSATIAVLQNFASQAGPDGVSSVLGLTGAIPILLGDNIGTTITALLASIGQSRNAKRTALAHCVFNISGAFLFIWLINPLARFIQWISPSGNEVDVISRQIANTHTTFNVVMTLIWIPLIGILVKIVMKLVPDKGTETSDIGEPIYLDSHSISQPVAALQLVVKEVIHCGDLVEEILKDVARMVKKDDVFVIEDIRKKCSAVGQLNEKITDYLADLFAGGVLIEEQATRIAGVMYVLEDINRISLLGVDMAEFMEEKTRKKYKYSKEAIRDLQNNLVQIEEMYSQVLSVMKSGDPTDAMKIVKKKEKVLEQNISIRKNHMVRLGEGKCKGKLATPFNKVLNSIDRMGNSCVNIADSVLGQVDFLYFMDSSIEDKS